MIRFRLGPIPVDVHFSHLVIAAVFGFSDLPPTGKPLSGAWPLRDLWNPASPQYGRTVVLFVLLWVAVIFVSVLVHELGHALVSSAFGYRPHIVLAGFGGHTQPNAPSAIPWHRDFLLTLAGPVFGLLLALGSWALWRGWSGGDGARFVLGIAYQANLWWAALNLVPVLPLDGGRMASAVLLRVFGKRGFVVAQALGLVVAAAITAWGALTGNLFVALMFGLFAARSVSLIAAYLRGEAPLQRPPHPGQASLEAAERLCADGRWADARQLCQPLTEADSPELRSRAHHVLGWIALKEGEGRAALDHFSQVQRQKVEPQALAAGFSLIGDEGRALPLWEMAARQSRDRTVLHEWAGSLIRAGRTPDAERIAGVDMAQAYRCAERVFFLRSEFLNAAQAGEVALGLEPVASVAYDAACAFARAGRPSEALRMLRRASELGFRDQAHAAGDRDLASLQGNPEFHVWMGSLANS